MQQYNHVKANWRYTSSLMPSNPRLYYCFACRAIKDFYDGAHPGLIARRPSLCPSPLATRYMSLQSLHSFHSAMMPRPSPAGRPLCIPIARPSEVSRFHAHRAKSHLRLGSEIERPARRPFQSLRGAERLRQIHSTVRRPK
eukprot:scaffold162871_cov23-Prasinocladus_malaysianus.AAC.2